MTITHSKLTSDKSNVTLPELQGSAKQIHWAESIRRYFLMNLTNFEDSGFNTRDTKNFVDAIQTMLANNPLAKTWIEKYQGCIPEKAITTVLEYYRETKTEAEVIIETTCKKGIVSELLMAKKNGEGICEVTYKNNNNGKVTTSIRKQNKVSSFPGEILVNVNTDVFAFIYNGNLADNIHWVGNYKQNIWSENITEEQKAVLGDQEKLPALEETQGEIYHETFSKILACVQSDIPVYLVGPAGSGKNHTLEQIAKKLNLKFFFTNSIQQEHKLTGFIDAGGTYHETEFYKAFTNGGLFFLDEMDASIPEVLVLLNAAIANGYFEFPNGRAEAHIDFRVVAAGNTMGSGADEQYTGRLVLDQATLDRFCVIEFDYDIRIEMKLANNNIELVTFVRDLRVQSNRLGIRTTYSYRCIMSATKLDGLLSIDEIMKIAIVKGIDKDTLKTYKADETNRYGKALAKLQRVS